MEEGGWQSVDALATRSQAEGKKSCWCGRAMWLLQQQNQPTAEVPIKAAHLSPQGRRSTQGTRRARWTPPCSSTLPDTSPPCQARDSRTQPARAARGFPQFRFNALNPVIKAKQLLL